jgi:tetratricopeptide (TPR) repeat protein/predicted Ser/Thr protein kinase
MAQIPTEGSTAELSGSFGKIGPYRVLKRLGAGGMGEVFLAYDERLDRQVAIKRIRSDAGASPDRRERFRREARVAAQLNHPALVQIYDVLAEGDVNYIVMEYVQGTNLRQLLEEEPLTVDEAVVIARDVAAGLAEAHRQGIVHRDLKSENILVTPSGHAKISDFGIAKSLLKGAEEPLTALGHVIGTYRSMSPEQARGEEVDHRSDLFSLGVLLYESLTGKSPFKAENELATIQRIVRDPQTPVREVVPAVPAVLSELVDHLLRKDPRLRPQDTDEVVQALEALGPKGTGSGSGTGFGTGFDNGVSADRTLAEPVHPLRSHSPTGQTGKGTFAPARFPLRIAAALLVLVAASVAAYLSLHRPAAALYVAVLPPKVDPLGNVEKDPELPRLLASGVRSSLVRALASLDGVSPKATEDVAGTSGSAIQVARAVAADEVVVPRLSCHAATCRITLDRIRGKDGVLLGSESFEVPRDNPYLAARAAANQLRRIYPEYGLRPHDPGLDVSREDFTELLRLRQRFEERRDSSLAPILEGLAAIRGRSPRFLDAYLLEAVVARNQFLTSRDARDLAHALEMAQEAQDLAPADPQPLFTKFTVALDGGQLATAEQALGDLERLTPGDPAVLEYRAQLLYTRGQAREAIAAMREAVRQRPSWKRLYKLAFFQQQHGETAEARLTLRRLLATLPGNLDGLSLLANLELTSGDARRAVQLYGEIVRRSPGLTEISNLGLAYFVLGNYAEAAKVFRRAAAQAPGNALVLLNLADSTLLAGRQAEAAGIYRRIVELIAQDPAAASNPQYLTVKGQALAHLGDGPGAVTAVQEAFARAPNSASVAYEASLIYALLGEDNSALVNAKKALELGYEPRWFAFPWFDRLRTHPDLQALLSRTKQVTASSRP